MAQSERNIVTNMSRKSIDKLPDFSKELDENQPGWRDQYQAWRQGGAKGAKGEVGDEVKEPLLGRMARGFTHDLSPHDHLRFAKMMPRFRKRTIGGDEDDDKQTNGEAIINLMNNCLGVGMLGVSYSLSKTGLAVGLGLMLTSATINAFTLVLHQKACKIVKCSSGGTELAETICGTKGKVAMTVLLTAFGYFCMVAMVDGSADAFYGLIALVVPSDRMPSESQCMVLCWVCFLLPPTLMRSMKSIAILSLVAMIACFVLVAMILISCGGRLVTQGLPSIADIKWYPDDAMDLMQGLPTLLMVFSIQACGGVVLATMKDTSMENITKVTVQSYVIVFALDIMVGVSVYLTFLSNTQSDIIKNMPKSSIIGILAMISQLVLLALSYMLMIIPCKIALLEILFGKNEENQEASYAQFYGTTLVVNAVALVNGLAVSDLSLIFGINGAVFTNLLAFILPTMLYVKAAARPEEDQVPIKATSTTNIGYYVIFIGGVCSLLLCTYQVILDISSPA